MPQVHPDVLRAGDPATLQAAEALVKALTVPDWGIKNFQVGSALARTIMMDLMWEIRGVY